ncbi:MULTISPECIES: STAS domain-containing protein [Streptomyces]|uniref:STAS domain-containing protein n=1 Tax=Streptomyces TaxID=1883 RepID=UPI000D505EDF|nr:MULTISPECIES: STAS domain-containing protein [Streptomyces]PVC64816.1 anti-sigma factor antagonist [Streptomyces sp. CS065A]
MTTTPRPDTAAETTAAGENRLHIPLHGDLDHENADTLVRDVTARLAARPGASDLRLDCAGLGHIDSMGLSALLMIHRHARAARVRLHLDDRPAHLERLLRLTGTLDHLTGQGGTQRGTEASQAEAPTDGPS